MRLPFLFSLAQARSAEHDRGLRRVGSVTQLCSRVGEARYELQRCGEDFMRLREAEHAQGVGGRLKKAKHETRIEACEEFFAGPPARRTHERPAVVAVPRALIRPANSRSSAPAAACESFSAASMRVSAMPARILGDSGSFARRPSRYCTCAAGDDLTCL